MKHSNIEKLANAIYVLRQKCLAKDKILIQNLGINMAEYNCLGLFLNDDHLSVKELAERLDITSGGVTRIVTTLEDNGILQRAIDPEDRRGIIVSLTPDGHEFLKDFKKKYLEIHKEILANVNAKNQNQLLEGMQNLLNALELWIDQNRN